MLSLQFRHVCKQVHKTAPELLKQTPELTDFIVRTDVDFGFVIAAHYACGDRDDALQRAEDQAGKQRQN